MKTLKKIAHSIVRGCTINQLKDPFFWNLYEAQRSPDSKAVTRLLNEYAKQNGIR